MTDLEKANIRIDCINKAMHLKRESKTGDRYANMEVIEIAKELEQYVLEK